MNKKIINQILLILILALIFILFKNYGSFSSLTLNIGLIYLTKVFPFLFIMMVINNLLININFPYYLSHIVKTPSLYTFILSIMSGSPLNAIILNNFLNQKVINEKDASIILSFTSFNNPLFLYNYFNLIFNNKLITLKLFFIIYLSNVILYFILKNKLKNNKYNISYKPLSFANSFTQSMKSASQNILNIFGTIFFFFLISNIIIKSNTPFSVLAKGIIEITQGLNGLINLNISLKIKELLVLAILQFQGLSIHMQIASVLSDYNINYKYFYLSRFLLIIISLALGMIT